MLNKYLHPIRTARLKKARGEAAREYRLARAVSRGESKNKVLSRAYAKEFTDAEISEARKGMEPIVEKYGSKEAERLVREKRFEDLLWARAAERAGKKGEEARIKSMLKGIKSGQFIKLRSLSGKIYEGNFIKYVESTGLIVIRDKLKKGQVPLAAERILARIN
jgi:hypothetical protein